MMETSVDMLDASLLADSTFASEDGSSVSHCQDEIGKENFAPPCGRNKSYSSHFGLKEQQMQNGPQSPLSDISQEKGGHDSPSNANDETRCSDLDSSSVCSSVASRGRNSHRDQSSNVVAKGTTQSSPFSGSIMQDAPKFMLPYSPTPRSPSRGQLSQIDRRSNSENIVDKRGLLNPRLDLEWRRQKEYNEFQSTFKNAVSNFERQNRHLPLREYTAMTPQKQRSEHQRVINLLDRLGIGCEKEQPVNGAFDTQKPQSGVDANLSLDSPSFRNSVDDFCPASRTDDSMYTLSPPPIGNDTQRSHVQKSKSASQVAPFADELSPIAGCGTHDGASLHSRSPAPERKEGSPMSFVAGGDSFQDLSVETTRQVESSLLQQSLYESPTLHESNKPNPYKRVASTSGKRGKDVFRRKYSSDSSIQGFPSPVNKSQSSDCSLSFVAHEAPYSQPFPSSQSPITGADRKQVHRGELSRDISPSASSASERQDRYGYRESNQSNSTADSPEAFVRFSATARPRWKEVSANVGLKEGVPLHYNPLQMKDKKRSNASGRGIGDRQKLPVEFRDPLRAFQGKGGESLHDVFEWIHARDMKCKKEADKWNSDSKGIIFSLRPVQILSATMKLLLEFEESSSRSADCDSSSLSGQTLIVVRAKEDIETWERSLRENTPFSVLSHADLPIRERKQTSAAARCATFDVVITTYDALKSPDITVQVDDDDHAVLGQSSESQGSRGWMVKRSSASGSSQRSQSQGIGSAVKCKKLSALHCVFWRRIVFIDELGRKGYSVKMGTARHLAAVAVSSGARFLFFPSGKEDTDTEHSAFENLLRSDKRAVQSVASVLRVEVDDDAEDIIDIIIDPVSGIVA